MAKWVHFYIKKNIAKEKKICETRLIWLSKTIKKGSELGYKFFFKKPLIKQVIF